jgi:hypothetical protein
VHCVDRLSHVVCACVPPLPYLDTIVLCPPPPLQAAASAPSIIFLDELDGLAPARSVR